VGVDACTTRHDALLSARGTRHLAYQRVSRRRTTGLLSGGALGRLSCISWPALQAYNGCDSCPLKSTVAHSASVVGCGAWSARDRVVSRSVCGCKPLPLPPLPARDHCNIHWAPVPP
jgi:hypothetical protein